MELHPKITLSIPTTAAQAFAHLWRDLRLAEGLDLDIDLQDPIEVENFDGATMVQWVVDVAPAVAPVFTAAIGYLVASRGEIEVERDGEKVRIKNLKPSRIREVLEIFDARNSKPPSDPQS
jgi:hypothetical protein